MSEKKHTKYIEIQKKPETANDAEFLNEMVEKAKDIFSSIKQQSDIVTPSDSENVKKNNQEDVKLDA